MRFISTRAASRQSSFTFSECVQRNLAPDDGLFVPYEFPHRSVDEFDGLNDIVSIGKHYLQPFFNGDPLQRELASICEAAFSFPIPLNFINTRTAVLELFHGPTAAFKDVGARFLAEVLARLPSSHERTVLVATSGDTGGAVAASLHRKANIRVVILYPQGKVSPFQEHQLTCWGDNVRALAVTGTFDDCQNLVKQAFGDEIVRQTHNLVSANSINIGRILPQQVYYAASSLWFLRKTGLRPNVIVPTGNLGNATAALWTKRCGLPLDRIVLSTNANRSIPDYLVTGRWAPKETIATIANAMDVGDPNNVERVLHLYSTLEALHKDVSASSFLDEEIRDAISHAYRCFNLILCPHTATAYRAHQLDEDSPAVLVATADAAKFRSIVEPVLGVPIPIPAALENLSHRQSRIETMEANFERLKETLTAG